MINFVGAYGKIISEPHTYTTSVNKKEIMTFYLLVYRVYYGKRKDFPILVKILPGLVTTYGGDLYKGLSMFVRGEMEASKWYDKKHGCYHSFLQIVAKEISLFGYRQSEVEIEGPEDLRNEHSNRVRRPTPGRDLILNQDELDKI